jgi:hypothetical protein
VSAYQFNIFLMRTIYDGRGGDLKIIAVRETVCRQERRKKSPGTTVPAFAYVRIWKHLRR